MGYSLDPIAADCYEGTFCLINKLGITDEEKLKRFEAAVTFAKISEIEKGEIDFPITPDGYRSIHRFIFEDIYKWAGEYRKVNISKKGTSFARFETIEQLMSACFTRLEKNDFFIGQKQKDYIENIADLYQTLNMIHPFREGNGRTERVFVSKFVRLSGHFADFSRVDEDELMIATIQAAGGVIDNLNRAFSLVIV